MRRFLIAVVLTCLTRQVRAEDFIIVSNGVPQCTIVVLEANKSDDSWFGACELTNHIYKITGAMVPVARDIDTVTGPVIVVGHCTAYKTANSYNPTFASQEYAVHFTNSAIFLLGDETLGGLPPAPVWPDLKWLPGSEFDSAWEGYVGVHGTLYAVYDFLEKYCGVHWYHVGDLGTTYPTRSTLTVPAQSLRRAPAMSYRSAPGLDKLADMILTAPAQWGTLPAEDHRKWALRNKAGGINFGVSHSLIHYHEYFSNPEWFARNTSGTRLSNKPCFSSTGFTAQVIADVQLFFTTGQNPHGMQIVQGCPSMTPDDGWGYCKCASCLAIDRPDNAGWMSCGEVSESFWGFVSRVGNAVAISHPGRKIASLAYQSYFNFPTNTVVPTNVVVGPCPFYNRFWVPGIEANPYFANEMNQITNWSTRFHGDMNGMWTYPCYPTEGTELSGYNCFPGFFAHQHARQMRYFYDNRIRGNNNCGGAELVDRYVITKFEDDPMQDVDAMLGNLFTNLYGPAVTPMFNLYREKEAAYSTMSTYSNGGFSSAEYVAWGYVGSAPRMAQWQTYIDQAKALATAEPYRSRVLNYETSIWKFMKDGFNRYQIKTAAATNEATTIRNSGMPSVTVYQAGGYGTNLSAVNWSLTPPIWAEHDLYGFRTERKAELRIFHDGTYVYARIVQDVTGDYLTGGTEYEWSDNWRAYFSADRVNAGIRQGFAMTSAIQNNAYPATSQVGGGQWTMTMLIPIADVLGRAWQPGDKIYMNFIRRGSQGNEWVQYSSLFGGGWPVGSYPARHGEFVLAAPRVGTTLFVNLANGSPQAPYDSWAKAATSIQDAMDVAQPADTVLVARGVYGNATRAADATNQVYMAYPVHLVASGTNPSLTVINGGGTRRGVAMTAGGTLRGFTITNGFSDGAGGVAAVAGLIENCIITSCRATNGHAGGVSVSGGGVIRNCLVVNNVATNPANDRDGGGIFLQAATAVNCTVTGNRTGRAGSGVCLDLANYSGTNDTAIFNSIVYGNLGSSSNIATKRSGTVLRVEYNCAPEQPAGIGNINSAPLFASGSYQLASNSPCINAGRNEGWMTGAVDVACNPRLNNGTVDMGAYESGFVTPPDTTPVWTAYNDALWNINDSPVVNYTTNSPLNGSGGSLVGSDGAAVSAAIGFSGTLTTPARVDYTTTLPAGSDSDAAFTGHVGHQNAFNWKAGNLTLTLANLNTGRQYTVTLLCTRGADSEQYSNRFTDVTISDVDAFQNTSSAGAPLLTQSAANDGVRLRSGWIGRVARFAGVRCGANRTIVFTLSPGADALWPSNPNQTNGYLCAVKIQEILLDGGGDTDSDGMPDTWEQEVFGGTAQPPAGDLDGDGLSNLDEYICGSHPTNSSSKFEATLDSTPTNAPNPRIIRWAGNPGRLYAIVHKASLGASGWTVMATNVPSSYPAMNVYTDNLHDVDDTGFYRLRVRLP